MRPFTTRWTIAGMLAVLALALVATGSAAPRSTSDTRQFDQKFTVNTDLLDTHMIYLNGLLPGQTWFRLRIGLQTSVEIDSRADINLSGLDDVAAGGTVGVQNALIARGAAVQDFVIKTEPYVNLDLAFDLFGRKCPSNFITNDAQLSAATGRNTCLDFAIHTGVFAPSPVKYRLLGENGRLPYSGSIFEQQVKPGFVIFDIGAFIGAPDMLVVTLDTDTQLTLTAPADKGWLGRRQVAPANAPQNVLSTRTVHWASESPVSDVIQAQCDWPVGQDLIYRMNNLRWEGTVNVDLVPQVSLRLRPIGGNTGIVLYGYDLPAINLLDEAPVTVPADPIAHTMGKVLPDNQVPSASPAGPYAGPEGSAVLFAATASDNCDVSGTNLSYLWNFGDGTTATGKTVGHAFTDNGNFAGTLTVSDGTNQVVKPFTAAISNVAPAGTFAVTSAVNGASVDATLAFTGVADPSLADTAAGFTYSFDCGAGFGPAGAASTRLCTNVSTGQAVKGRVLDKDGGVTEYAGIVNSPAQVNLGVVVSGGDGTARVDSSPAGITCPSDCAEGYPMGTAVTLTAVESPTTEFRGWRNCESIDPVNPKVCHVAMTEDKSVTAVFRDISVALTVQVFGTTATGLVSSDPGAIVCTPDCTDSYPANTVVTLTAVQSTVANGNAVAFHDWGATCRTDPDVPNTSNVCVVTMDVAKTVTAFFTDAGF